MSTPHNHLRKSPRLHVVGFVLTLALGALTVMGCDDTQTTGLNSDATTDGAAVPSSALTPWSPTAATTAVPTFNKSCRFGADTVFESGSNGATDDALTLTSDATSASLNVTVSGGTTNVLVAAVTLDRGLADKSWRDAAGTATWNGISGTVVDGAICFEAKLATGTPSRGELTLVMQAPDGSYHSVSGGFTTPASAVKPATGETVAAPLLDIDLR